VLGAGACAPENPVPGSAAASPGLCPTPPPHPDGSPIVEGADVVGSINSIGTEKYPTIYTGVSPVSGGTITIFDTKSDPAFMRAVMAINGVGSFAIHEQHVARSLSELVTLTNRISDDNRDLAKLGVEMGEWGPDPAASDISVQLTTPAGCRWETVLPDAQVAAAQRVFDERYGKGLVSVSNTSAPRVALQDLGVQPNLMPAVPAPQ
jgi:hypothetical protein